MDRVDHLNRVDMVDHFSDSLFNGWVTLVRTGSGSDRFLKLPSFQRRGGGVSPTGWLCLLFVHMS